MTTWAVEREVARSRASSQSSWALIASGELVASVSLMQYL